MSLCFPGCRKLRASSFERRVSVPVNRDRRKGGCGRLCLAVGFMRKMVVAVSAAVVVCLCACAGGDGEGESAARTVVSMQESIEESGAVYETVPDSLSIREEDPVNAPETEPEMKLQVYANAYISTGKGKIRLQVESNPSTGFTWRSAVSDESVLCLTDEDYIPYEYDEGKVGVGGLRVFDYLAGSPGISEITLTYSRTFEEGTEVSVKRFRFRVEGDLEVTLLSAEDPDLPEESYNAEEGGGQSAEAPFRDEEESASVPSETELLTEKMRSKEVAPTEEEMLQERIRAEEGSVPTEEELLREKLLR